MQITHLGHAGWWIDTGDAKILCDPWKGRNTKFQGSWTVWPPNDHIDWWSFTDPHFLYISHAHEDHLDAEFLRHVSKDCTVLLPSFRHPVLEDRLRRMGFKWFLRSKDGPLRTGGTRVEVFPFADPTRETEDSSLLVEHGGKRFLDGNDSRLAPDQVAHVLREFGPVDVYTGQYSCAGWWPAAYNYTPERYRELCRSNIDRCVRRFLTAADAVGARVAVPSSGPPLLLGEAFRHNYQQVGDRGDHASPFPDYSEIPWHRYRSSARVVAVNCGTRFDIAGAAELPLTYHMASRINHAATFGPTHPRHFRGAARECVRKFAGVLRECVAANPWLAGVINETLWIYAGPARVMVSFRDARVIIDNVYGDSAPAPPYHRITVPEDVFVEAVTSGLDDWEDVVITMRCRLDRDPDVYNPWVWTFWKNLDPDRLRAIGEDCRRGGPPGGGTVVKDGYRIPARCPHLGVSLADYGRIDPAADTLTCTAHGYQWRLSDGSPIGHTLPIARPEACGGEQCPFSQIATDPPAEGA